MQLIDKQLATTNSKKKRIEGWIRQLNDIVKFMQNIEKSFFKKPLHLLPRIFLQITYKQKT